MKVISYNGAIAALQFVPDEIVPLGGYFIPKLIAEIAKRYQFATLPKSSQEVTEIGAKFKIGHFNGINIVELGFFNDVLSVTTRDTKDSEAVLSDAAQWLKDTFAFRDPTTPAIPAFQSDLVVEFDNSPEKIASPFAALTAFIQEERDKLKYPFKPVSFGRLSFGADPLITGPNAEFTVERRADVAWEKGRYFSKAYLTTSAHIKGLELLDKLLGKKR